MDLTPTTPQTSSGSSTDLASTAPDPELDAGSECGWRDTDTTTRPIFYMSDEEASKFSALSGLYKNLDGQKIRVGICAMAKKTNSKPMKEILGRLGRFENLQVDIFNENVILNEPVEDWPVVDALISFFSSGFPLQKAIQYKNLHKPFVVNDLEAQYAIKDRREVYKILVREGISHPRYAVLNRDGEEKGEFEDTEDAIDVNGTQFQRPFVEKPVDAEDHNIYIYFPVSAGGGCQKLFRKVGSRSSVYSTTNRVRKTGSFIYEDFMPTDGTDVKVYTVGPDYAHAEARKSPALDGKVERDKEGKEVRYPVILSATEKMIARKVCLAFKQNVCGFDLLRTGGKSYVCDVNGFSFVKNSTKYYDDCANVLGTMIIRALAPQLHIPLILGAAPEDIPVVPTTSGSMMELRCVIAVIRHGDRTPKQKMKMEVKNKKFFDLFEKYNGFKKGHLKLKKPKQLQEVLDIARDLLSESHHVNNAEVQEKKAKLHQLKLVLEMYGHFSGINRKVQLKYQPNGAPKKSSSEEDEFPKESSLVLIVKWGGELTPAGKYQAEDLGKAFRTLYPGGEFDTPGLGFLRLHSTFRHDLKIYASDEGRVQMTAAAFTKGLLALEGELTPILVSMVKSANTNGLLDKEGETSKYQHIVKEKLMEILNQDSDFTAEDVERLSPTKMSSILNAMDYVKNPKKMCDQIYDMVCQITTRIKSLKLELKTRDLKLYHGESWELLIRRWSKLEKDFKLKSGNYNISKIPDIYDCIKYDLQHNHKTLQYARSNELFKYSKAMADIVIPQEYGITVEEKVHISQSICTPLMRKIHSDLVQAIHQPSDEHSTRLNSKYSKGVTTPERFVRTRLYFTSESHIHSLLNMLRYGGLCDVEKDEQWKKAMNFLSSTPELNYMTQINIMMFEDSTKEPSSPEKFHIELHFSPGAYTCSDKNVVNPVSSGYRTSFLVKQADKLKDPNAKDMKPECSSGLLKDIMNKDGLIIEEISEETSEGTVSGQSSIVVTNSAKNSVILDESGVQNFFRNDKKENDVCQTVKSSIPVIEINDEKESDVKITDKTGEQITIKDAVPKMETGIPAEASPANKEDTSNTVDVGDEKVQTKPDESAEKVKRATLERDGSDATITEGSNIAVAERSAKDSVDNISDTVGSNELSKNSSNSSVYLTAEEPEDDDKPEGTKLSESLGDATKVVNDIAEDKTATNKPDSQSSVDKSDKSESNVDKQGVDKEYNVDVTAIENEANDSHDDNEAGGESKGETDTITESDSNKPIIASELLGKGPGAKSKSPIKFPDSLNLQMTGSTQKGNEVKKQKFDDIEHELLFPVEMKDVPEPKSPDPDIPEWDWDDGKEKKFVPEPKSPDPSIPEWDWDDGKEKEKFKPTSVIAKLERPKSAESVVSTPITIKGSGSSARNGGDGKKTYEENRSHSLEENDSKDGGLGNQERRPSNRYPFRYSLSDVFSAGKLEDTESMSLLENHYRTIHLPINNSSHHSFSSLLYLNPDAFKAFDGFNMVPSLKPLETLHNNLTMLDLDSFLCRSTTTKFFTPDSSNVTTPLPSPRCPELNRAKSSGPSLPSSSNSSAGPSSPTCATTPDDFLNRLKMYIMDTVKNDQSQTEPDADRSSESSFGSVGLKHESNQATIVPQKKPIQISEPYLKSPSPSGSLNMSNAGHVSAFKAVSRSSSLKTQFIVTHVPEDSLLKKSEKGNADEKQE